MMRLRKTLAFVAVGTTFALGTVGMLAGAVEGAAAIPSAGNAGHLKGGQNCATVIGKSINGQPSKVISQTCSSDPAARPLQPQGTVALVTFFEDANYVGYYDTVYGKDGPCDSSGYGLSDLTGAEFAVNGISSYYYFNNCNAQRLYTDTYYGGTQSNVLYGDRAYVGDTFNDNVWSMRLWHQ